MPLRFKGLSLTTASQLNPSIQRLHDKPSLSPTLLLSASDGTFTIHRTLGLLYLA